MFGRQKETKQATDGMMATMEELPIQVYWGAAVASLVISAILYLFGKRTAAIFVGQWPPTLILLSLFYRLLRPSEEDAGRSMERAKSRARASMR